MWMQRPLVLMRSSSPSRPLEASPKHTQRNKDHDKQFIKPTKNQIITLKKYQEKKMKNSGVCRFTKIYFYSVVCFAPSVDYFGLSSVHKRR